MAVKKTTFQIPGSAEIPMALDAHFNDLESNLPLVIYCHGINGFKDWGGMNEIADIFAQAGFAFLKFNFSHNGTTVSDATNFVDLGLYGQDSYLKRQFDLLQVLEFVMEKRSSV